MKRTGVSCLPLKLAGVALVYTMLGMSLADHAAAEESAGRPLCTLLKRDNAAKRIGKPVDAGKVAEGYRALSVIGQTAPAATADNTVELLKSIVEKRK